MTEASKLGRGLVLAGTLIGLCPVSRIAAQGCDFAPVLAFAVLGSAIYDIATTPRSVKKHNAARLVIAPRIDRRSYGVSISVSPWPTPVRQSLSTQSPGKAIRASLAATRPARDGELLNPWKAVRASLAATTLPIAAGITVDPEELAAILVLGGVVLGPSAGHFYARQAPRALSGIALRAGLTGAALASAYRCLPST